MQNPEAKEDVRIQRTRKLLQQALIDLTVEMGFAVVTVRDICNRAMVNRSTFYRYYLDKFDLLDQYMAEVQAATAAAALSSEKTGSMSSVPSGLLLLVKQVEAHADFYRVMLGRKGDPAFVERFRQNSEGRYRYLFSQQPSDVDPNAAPVEMKVAYISHAGVGAILWWLENNMPCTPEQLAIWLGQLSMTSAGLTSLPISSKH